MQKILDSDADRILGSLGDTEAAIMNRMFLRIALLILIFFSALLGYRYISGRLFPTQTG